MTQSLGYSVCDLALIVIAALRAVLMEKENLLNKTAKELEDLREYKVWSQSTSVYYYKYQ